MEKLSSQKKTINNKYIKWLVITALALFTIFKWPTIVQDSKNISNIKKWRLEYTEKWWWIDWWHATPWWARHLRNRVNDPKAIPGSDHYGLVYYGQYQRKRKFKDGVEKEYIVRKNMTQEEKESVALAIFLEVSREFEEHQQITDFITGSSYDAADMFSNVVWYYRAVRGYSEDEVRWYLNPLWADSSLVLYKKNKIGKNQNIGVVITQWEEWLLTEKYPYPFNQIRTVRKWKFYGNTWILFRDFVPVSSSDQLTFLGYTPTWFERFAVHKEYETQVSEASVKQRLYAIHPKLYKDTKVLINNKQTYREVIPHK
jgi:hypothetical protein